MKIREMMTVDVATLDPEDTIEQAARVMRDANVGFAPVVSNRMVLGVLTDRDIVLRAAAKGYHMRLAKVLDILTPGAVHCAEDDDVQDAANLMAENHVRRLIVVKPDNTLAGVVSLADIAEHAGETAKVVGDILRSAPPTEAETSLRGAGVSETGETPAVRTGPLGSLVRGELSSIETYKLALRKVGGEPAGDELRRIEREHEEAVDLLLERLRLSGEPEPKSSGLRGRWSKAFETAALIVGRKAALRALKQEEAHGLHGYEKALEDESLDPEVKELIRARLLPRARSHIPALDRLLAESR
ncbi:MAG: CBS domain-containing protein [Elusimicrobia bacterium]|nr:CBS domain-containing protein [Elusimicrobiota bacterium]